MKLKTTQEARDIYRGNIVAGKKTIAASVALLLLDDADYAARLERALTNSVNHRVWCCHTDENGADCTCGAVERAVAAANGGK